MKRACILGMLTAVLTVGCAGGRSAATAAPGTPFLADTAGPRGRCTPVDTVLRLDTPIHRDCDVETKARLISSGRFAFQPASSKERSCFRAIVDVVVDEQGVPMPQTLHLVASNDHAFTGRVMELVRASRYAPARRGGMAVKQWVRVDKRMNYALVLVGRPRTGRPEYC